MHHTEEIEFGLLPTPKSMDGMAEDLNSGKELKVINGNFVNVRPKDGMRFGPSLNDIAKAGLLPTPTAMDSTNATANMKSTQVKEGSMHSVTLARAMTMGILPTPTAGIVKHGNTEKYWENRMEKKRQMDMAMWNAQINGSTSQLSPQFVMEMMGFPTDWTLLPFLNGEKNQSKQEETQ